MKHILCKMYDTGAILSFRALKTFGERMRGLLGTSSTTGGVALCGCLSVHTWGMRYDLDVALISRSGEVLKSKRAVAPGHMVSAPRAYYALERPASPVAWPSVGSWVTIAEVDHKACERFVLVDS